MKIEITRPPKHIWEKAHSMFELDDRHVVYTYGDTLHNPGAIEVDKFLEAHESLHAVQQAAAGGPDKWWARYFSDEAFRRAQELEAYQIQYDTFCANRLDRNARARYVWELAKHLSSNMYGAGITHAEAIKAIKS